MSRKNPDSKTEPSLSEAAEKTERVLRGLQSRLAEHAGGAAPAAPTASPLASAVRVQSNDSAENLEWELQRYFEAEMSQSLATLPPLHMIRERVIEGVTDKVLHGWEWTQNGKVAPLEKEVIERLVDRVYERLSAATYR